MINNLEQEYDKLKVQYIDDSISYIALLIERDKQIGDILVSMPKHIDSIINDNDVRRVVVTPACKKVYERNNNELSCG